jgi:hypothetical protein
MKIAYLLFVYKNPLLLERIVEHLSCDDSAFFVHLDLKSDIGDFSAIRGKNVFFTRERIPVYWAEFSGNRAMMILIREALASREQYDYFVLLSGSEYPLQSRQYIHNFLEANHGTEYINMVKMPNEAAGKPISRINTLRIQSHRPVYRTLVRVLAKMGLAQRDHAKYLGEMKPYAGNTWWALSHEACKYIMDFEAGNSRVVSFFEDCFAPEETYFHTILGNSRFAARVRRNLVYEDWSESKAHPAMIDEKHIAIFKANDRVCVTDVYGAGEVLFARKFSDSNVNLIDRVNEMIKCKTKRQPSANSI